MVKICTHCKIKLYDTDVCNICGKLLIQPSKINNQILLTRCSKCLDYYDSKVYDFCPSCALWKGFEDET